MQQEINHFFWDWGKKEWTTDVSFFPAKQTSDGLGHSLCKDERTKCSTITLNRVVTSTETLTVLLFRGMLPFVLLHRWLALKPLKHYRLQLGEKPGPCHSGSLLLNQWSIHSNKKKIQNKYCYYSTYPGSIVSVCWLYGPWDSVLVNIAKAPFRTWKVRAYIILMKA